VATDGHAPNAGTWCGSMASVIVNSSRTHQYVQVVDYYKERGHRKRKSLKSFGPKSVESLMRAHLYAAEFNALEKLLEKKRWNQNYKHIDISMIVFGHSLGKETIDYLYNKTPS